MTSHKYTHSPATEMTKPKLAGLRIQKRVDL
jgi:hypothetical protein